MTSKIRTHRILKTNRIFLCSFCS